jgi:CobQ-like glutamine amidotransferase family enzyme
MDLHIGHLYPDLMSIYGDRGNVLTLMQRAKWRDIDAEARAFTAGEAWDPEWADVYFFGGGQDLGQDIVGTDLQGEHGDQLKRSIAGGAAVFSVCGGYQLLGSEYVPEVGDPIPGLGVMDVSTRAGKERFVGNLLAETDDGRMLIGFENHSGYTYLGPKAKPLGRVVAGHGNNGKDKTEGAVQGKLIGCYLHGSALPKNPWLADQLIRWALERRHGAVELGSLDDSEEYAAQAQAAEVAKTRT